MHDISLEERLRRTLREEGDALPFSVTIDRLEARLATRRRGSRNVRLGLLASAAVVAVAAGAGLAALVNRDDETPGLTPSASVPASPSLAPSASPEPSATPSPTPTPPLSARPLEAFGAPNEAVVVRREGDPVRPDQISVSLTSIDAGSLETNLQPRVVARFAGSTIPDGLVLADAQPKYGSNGWLALGVLDEAQTASTLVYDLRSPDAAPWLIHVSVDRLSWGAATIAASTDGQLVTLWDAERQTSSTLAAEAGVEVGAGSGDPWTDPPSWLSNGSGFLALHRQDGFAPEIGWIDMNGTFTRTVAPEPVRLGSGRERRWGIGGSSTTSGCPTEGGPPGCRVAVTAVDGGGAVDWYTEDMDLGEILDHEFDAQGDGLWLLLRRPAEDGAAQLVILHADAPRDWVEIASTPDTAPDDAPRLLGIRDAAETADDRLFLIGVARFDGPPIRVISADGARNSFPDRGFFAGWAGGQPDFPTN